MKEEQVKGCGSVNRPTPGSQRPAEPVATGFLRGVNYLIFRGRFWGLGVKLGVVNARISQCSAILYGVRIGVLAIPAISRASRAPGCPPCTLCGGEPPRSPLFFLRPYSAKATSKIALLNKDLACENSPPQAGVSPPIGGAIFLRPI